MPKDPKYEYVRVRTRKDKEKDRDGDTRSVAGSSVTTIRDRRHRNSFTSQPSSSGDTVAPTAASSCQDVPLEQLPALPETEESESASNGTSPILRTTSNISNPTSISSPFSIETPATLQPYLEESKEESVLTMDASRQVAKGTEWIGPRPDGQHQSEVADSMTPKPRAGTDPFASYSENTMKEGLGSRIDTNKISEGHHVLDKPRKSSPDETDKIYSWAKGSDGARQYFHISQMGNPFLPPGSSLDSALMLQPTSDSYSHQTPSSTLSPPSPPPRNNPELQTHSTTNIQPPAAKVHRHLARLEDPPQRLPSPVISDVSRTFTFPSPMASVQPPAPQQQHPYSNTMSHLVYPPGLDHPANLLHRIENALPDISALIGLYQNTCSHLAARDQHISDLAAQKAAQAERLNDRIGRLSDRIESMLKDQAAQVNKLKSEIAHGEDKYRKMQSSCVKERQLKEEARTTNANLKKRYEEMQQKHREALESLQHKFAEEKALLVKDHTFHKEQLMEEVRSTARLADETLVAKVTGLERMHDLERKSQEDRWSRRMHDLECDRSNSEAAVALKRKEVEEIRQESHKSTEAWITEREAIKKAEADQRRITAAQYQKEKDNMRTSIETVVAQQRAEIQELNAKYRDEIDELRQVLAGTHEHYKSEIQAATDAFRNEKEVYRKATEDASSRQILDMQDKARDLQKEKDSLQRLQRSPQSQRSDELQESIPKLQKEKDPVPQPRGPSQSRRSSEIDRHRENLEQPQRETLAKMPSRGHSRTRQQEDCHDKSGRTLNDGDVSSSKCFNDKARVTKARGEECVQSRSSTPAPKEDRAKANRASVMYGSSTNAKAKSSSAEAHSKGGQYKAENGQRGQGERRTS
ncbi:uncharacterized protein KY384_004214 [Bacidia gigantensis]|uniref:uncharacterized protein n=1 Tax=Bacidia gigantensis TaxID=2732470 RepID=UPI001D03FF54|nr:uncharacterized protein KY384_004214 [Bacidia gigantensis]KAG8530857.1 hypothetical protein KY384_004214 [Bacidia gigantensis]